MLLVEYKDNNVKNTLKTDKTIFFITDKNRQSVKVTNFNNTKKEESHRTIRAINT